jgi:hypothetical protein
VEGVGLEELVDEQRRFVAREFAARLALGEAEWPPGITETGVARLAKERLEVLQLFAAGGRARRLTKGHG